MTTSRALALTFLALSISGCPNSRSSSPIPFDEYPERSAEAVCALFFGCCTEMERDSIFGGMMATVTTEAECRTAYLSMFASGTAMYQASIDAGRVRYDGSSAARCVDYVDEVGCGAFATFSVGGAAGTPCASVFVPLVEAGGACSSPVDCPGFACVSGTCAEIVGEGEACATTGTFCDAGLFCDTSAAMPACRRRRANGEVCASPYECESSYCGPDGVCAARAPICDGV